MYKKTLLSIVQDALESMDSDAISSIYDTREAEQAANIAKQTYEFMHTTYDWPYQNKFTSLEGLSDSNYPTYLKIPDDISELKWVKYRGVELMWISPEEFVTISDARRQAFLAGDSRIEEVLTLEGIKIYIRNDQDPKYYTSFDNRHLVALSYDFSQEATLQEANTSAYCVAAATFIISDTAVPFLPDNMFPTFQAEVNKAVHLYLRQQASPVDMQRSLVSRSKMKTKSDKVNKYKRKGFGRK